MNIALVSRYTITIMGITHNSTMHILNNDAQALKVFLITKNMMGKGLTLHQTQNVNLHNVMWVTKTVMFKNNWFCLQKVLTRKHDCPAKASLHDVKLCYVRQMGNPFLKELDLKEKFQNLKNKVIITIISSTYMTRAPKRKWSPPKKWSVSKKRCWNQFLHIEFILYVMSFGGAIPETSRRYQGCV